MVEKVKRSSQSENLDLKRYALGFETLVLYTVKNRRCKLFCIIHAFHLRLVV